MAGRVQLGLTGPQDAFLTQDPEYTFFNQKARKYTHFALEHVRLDFDGTVDFGNTVTCKVPMNIGDLIKTVSLEIDMPPGIYVKYMGNLIIEYIDFKIGGSIIQRINADYLIIHSEIQVSESKQSGLVETLGQNVTPNILYGTKKIFIDIPFYFLNNPGLAVPLCAITKQEVEFDVKIRRREPLLLQSPFVYETQTQVSTNGDMTFRYFNLRNPISELQDFKLWASQAVQHGYYFYDKNENELGLLFDENLDPVDPSSFESEFTQLEPSMKLFTPLIVSGNGLKAYTRTVANTSDSFICLRSWNFLKRYLYPIHFVSFDGSITVSNTSDTRVYENDVLVTQINGRNCTALSDAGDIFVTYGSAPPLQPNYFSNIHHHGTTQPMYGSDVAMSGNGKVILSRLLTTPSFVGGTITLTGYDDMDFTFEEAQIKVLEYLAILKTKGVNNAQITAIFNAASTTTTLVGFVNNVDTPERDLKFTTLTQTKDLFTSQSIIKLTRELDIPANTLLVDIYKQVGLTGVTKATRNNPLNDISLMFKIDGYTSVTIGNGIYAIPPVLAQFITAAVQATGQKVTIKPSDVTLGTLTDSTGITIAYTVANPNIVHYTMIQPNVNQVTFQTGPLAVFKSQIAAGYNVSPNDVVVNSVVDNPTNITVSYTINFVTYQNTIPNIDRLTFQTIPQTTFTLQIAGAFDVPTTFVTVNSVVNSNQNVIVDYSVLLQQKIYDTTKNIFETYAQTAFIANVASTLNIQPSDVVVNSVVDEKFSILVTYSITKQETVPNIQKVYFESSPQTLFRQNIATQLSIPLNAVVVTSVVENIGITVNYTIVPYSLTNDQIIPDVKKATFESIPQTTFIQQIAGTLGIPTGNVVIVSVEDKNIVNIPVTIKILGRGDALTVHQALAGIELQRSPELSGALQYGAQLGSMTTFKIKLEPIAITSILTIRGYTVQNFISGFGNLSLPALIAQFCSIPTLKVKILYKADSDSILVGFSVYGASQTPVVIDNQTVASFNSNPLLAPQFIAGIAQATGLPSSVINITSLIDVPCVHVSIVIIQEETTGDFSVYQNLLTIGITNSKLFLGGLTTILPSTSSFRMFTYPIPEMIGNAIFPMYRSFLYTYIEPYNVYAEIPLPEFVTDPVTQATFPITYCDVSPSGRYVLSYVSTYQLEPNNNPIYLISVLDTYTQLPTTNKLMPFVGAPKNLRFLNETTFVVDFGVAVDIPLSDVLIIPKIIITSFIYSIYGDIIQSPQENNAAFKMNLNLKMVHLDNKEAASYDGDYVITQLQKNTSKFFPVPNNESEISKHRLTFVNPVKEMFSYVHPHAYLAITTPDLPPIEPDYAYSRRSDAPVGYNLYMDDAKVIVDESSPYLVMRNIQVGYHHTRLPDIIIVAYNFGCEPEKAFPTGQRNFSHTKENVLLLNWKGDETSQYIDYYDLLAYALSYNILRIQNGYARTIFDGGQLP